VKFFSSLFLFLSSLLIISTANAQLRSTAIDGYIESKESIAYSQLDLQCIKNDPNQMEYNYTGEIQTTQIQPNIYHLAIQPIRFNTPMVQNLINCKVTVLLYIKPHKFLRFIIAGSSKPMTMDDLKLLVNNQKGLTINLSQKLNYAKLTPALPSPNGYRLLYYPVTALPYSVKHPQKIN
jgi:hypothetical protein